MVRIGSITRTNESVQEPVPHTGFFFRDMTLAGTLPITGVGFRPSHVIFLACETSELKHSIGFDDGVTRNAIVTMANLTNDPELSTGLSVRLDSSGSDIFRGEILTMDSDGFTMNFTKTNSPTGTARVVFLAFK